jgi:neutral ceramidase
MKPQRHRDTEISQRLIRERKTRSNSGKFFAVPLFRLFSVSLCLCGYMFFAVSARAELQAGASRVIITPDQKVFSYQLGGYVSPQRLAHNAVGVHDNCYARAVVVSDGTNKCAVVSLDLCFMPANVKTAVVSRIGATGIPASGVFLSATHTHSAPDPLALHSGNTGPAGALSTYDAKLTDWFADRIAQSITEANTKLKPVRIGSGQMEALGLNRNRRGEKITDDEMTALKVMDTEGKPVAAIFNYAAHPVYYGAEMLQVSGDWSGAFTRQMEAVLPGSVVLFLNGAEGDASPNGADEGTNAEKIDTYSAKICEKARKLYDGIAVSDAGKVSAWVQDTELPERKPHPFFLLAAGALKATAEQAKELVNHTMPIRCEVSFVHIGDLLLMGVPGEPTAPIGLAAKAAAREKGAKMVGIVALTNGWLGYIVTPEQYKAGKYEPTMSFYGDQVGVKMLEGLKAGLARY